MTLGEALKQYRRDVAAKKRHPAQENGRIDRWLRNDLCFRSLANLKGADFARYRDQRRALASLLDRPQMAEEFGEGLTLAIRAIMCDQAGSNLRNDVAHGLADEALCSSAFALYAWWMVLQLITAACLNYATAVR